MIRKILLLALIIVSLFVESTIVPFPFVLLFSLLYLYFADDILAVVVIFLSSIFLDILLFNDVGLTGIFISVIILSLAVLEKVFSFQGVLPFVVLVLVGIILYGYVVGYPFSIPLFAVLLAGLLTFSYIERKKERKGGILAQKI